MNESIYLKNNFFSDDECDFLISYYKDRESSSHYYECNQTHTLTILSSDENNIDDALRPFYDKIQNIITKIEGPNLYINVSEIVKWLSGSSVMKPHLDRKEDLFGVIIYLNDDFLGGKTYFKNGIMISPKKGSILLFTGNCCRRNVPSNATNHILEKITWSLTCRFR